MELSREQELIKRVINEAWEDENFKRHLIKNPSQAIEDLTGARLNIPEGKSLVVRDQTSEEVIYINIPAEHKLEDIELNEEQLEAVAGGKSIQNFLTKPLENIIFDFPPMENHPSGNNLNLSKSK